MITIRTSRETFERVLALAGQFMERTGPTRRDEGDPELAADIKAIEDLDREVILAVVNENAALKPPNETL